MFYNTRKEAKKYGLEDGNSAKLYVCPVGLNIGERVKTLAERVPEFEGVRSYAEDLEKKSVYSGKGFRFNSEDIKDGIISLRTVLATSEAVRLLKQHKVLPNNLI
jgi:hypothetical protein